MKPRNISKLLGRKGGSLVDMDHCNVTSKPRSIDWILGTVCVVLILSIAFLVPG